MMGDNFSNLTGYIRINLRVSVCCRTRPRPSRKFRTAFATYSAVLRIEQFVIDHLLLSTHHPSLPYFLGKAMGVPVLPLGSVILSRPDTVGAMSAMDTGATVEPGAMVQPYHNSGTCVS